MNESGSRERVSLYIVERELRDKRRRRYVHRQTLTLFSRNVWLIPDLAGIAHELDVGVSNFVGLGVGVNARAPRAVVLYVRGRVAGAVYRGVGYRALQKLLGIVKIGW